MTLATSTKARTSRIRTTIETPKTLSSTTLRLRLARCFAVRHGIRRRRFAPNLDRRLREFQRQGLAAPSGLGFGLVSGFVAGGVLPAPRDEAGVEALAQLGLKSGSRALDLDEPHHPRPPELVALAFAGLAQGVTLAERIGQLQQALALVGGAVLGLGGRGDERGRDDRGRQQ